MERNTEAKVYRSPTYKLLPFFHRSRDQWKEKCQDRNLRIKRLENRVEGLKVSRHKWKAKAQARQARIVELTRALEAAKTASA